VRPLPKQQAVRISLYNNNASAHSVITSITALPGMQQLVQTLTTQTLRLEALSLAMIRKAFDRV
jgi:hypothetical protein